MNKLYFIIHALLKIIKLQNLLYFLTYTHKTPYV